MRTSIPQPKHDVEKNGIFNPMNDPHLDQTDHDLSADIVLWRSSSPVVVRGCAGIAYVDPDTISRSCGL